MQTRYEASFACECAPPIGVFPPELDGIPGAKVALVAVRAAILLILALGFVKPGPAETTDPSKPTKEYIRLGGRKIAIDKLSKISGRVTAGGAALAGVTVSLSGELALIPNVTPDIAPAPGVIADSLAGRLAALGWTGGSGIIDVVASGTLTLGGRTEKLVLKVKAGARQRVERPESAIIVVVNNGHGYVLNNGKSTPLKIHESIAAVPWMFPVLTPLIEQDSAQIPPLSNQDSALTVYQFSKTYSVRDSLDSLRNRYQSARLSFDKGQGRLVKVEFQRPSKQSAGQSVRVEWLLSDYRQSGPLSLPYRIEERVYGRSMSVMQFDRVDVNAGISDQEFEVKN